MTPAWLLHTATARDLITGASPHLRAHLLALDVPRLGISVVTQAALLESVDRLAQEHGDRYTRVADVLDEFFRWVEILPWDQAAASRYVQCRGLVRRGELALGEHDLMLAAHALSAELPLVSADAAFDTVPGLRREDWRQPVSGT